LGQYTKRKDPPFFLFLASTSSFYFFFFEKNGADNGLKTKKGSTVGHEQTKKMMRLLERLSVGAMGQEPKRGRLRAKKKKKRSPLGQLSVGAVGQEPKMD
jgi:hypothetical protein